MGNTDKSSQLLFISMYPTLYLDNELCMLNPISSVIHIALQFPGLNSQIQGFGFSQSEGAGHFPISSC